MGYIDIKKIIGTKYILKIPDTEAKRIRNIDPAIIDKIIDKMIPYVDIPMSMASNYHIFIYNFYPEDILKHLDYHGIKYEVWEAQPEVVVLTGAWGKYRRINYRETKRIK